MQVLPGGGIDVDVATVLLGGQGSLPAWQRLDHISGDVRESQREKSRQHQEDHAYAANSHDERARVRGRVRRCWLYSLQELAKAAGHMMRVECTPPRPYGNHKNYAVMYNDIHMITSFIAHACMGAARSTKSQWLPSNVTLEHCKRLLWLELRHLYYKNTYTHAPNSDVCSTSVIFSHTMCPDPLTVTNRNPFTSYSVT